MCQDDIPEKKKYIQNFSRIVSSSGFEEIKNKSKEFKIIWIVITSLYPSK